MWETTDSIDIHKRQPSKRESPKKTPPGCQQAGHLLLKLPNMYICNVWHCLKRQSWLTSRFSVSIGKERMEKSFSQLIRTYANRRGSIDSDSEFFWLQKSMVDEPSLALFGCFSICVLTCGIFVELAVSELECVVQQCSIQECVSWTRVEWW